MEGIQSRSDSVCLETKSPVLGGKFTLLGSALSSLATAVGSAVLGCLTRVGYYLSFGYWQSAQDFSAQQMQIASLAREEGLHALSALLFPQGQGQEAVIPSSLPPGTPTPVPAPSSQANTPTFLSSQGEGQRASIPSSPSSESSTPVPAPSSQADTLTAQKLAAQLRRAQEQSDAEPDGIFRYMPALADFRGEERLVSISGVKEVGICHFQGRRKTMEDAALADEFLLEIDGGRYPVQLFAVFDGHGGQEAALYLRENLMHVLSGILHETCREGLTDEAIWQALKEVFVRLDAGITGRSGSTAVVAMILNDQLWTANVGDSRAFLDDGTQLSADQKPPTDPKDPYYAKDMKGIEKRGGFVMFKALGGMLAVARAVGDHGILGINPRPKITVCSKKNLPEGTHLILTCDGFFEEATSKKPKVGSTRQVAAAVREHRSRPADALAIDIVSSAYQAGSGDNLTAVVVKL